MIWKECILVLSCISCLQEEGDLHDFHERWCVLQLNIFWVQSKERLDIDIHIFYWSFFAWCLLSFYQFVGDVDWSFHCVHILDLGLLYVIKFYLCLIFDLCAAWLMIGILKHFKRLYRHSFNDCLSRCHWWIWWSTYSHFQKIIPWDKFHQIG